jgi:predicted DCC family thiol-disulfide oxidoreductase YuxK
MKSETSKYIIFFDGHCGLCNGFVDFVIRNDNEMKFQFSPLQSDFANENLTPEDVQDLKSVIVQISGKTFKKSQAVFAVLSELGGTWRWLCVFAYFPSVLRNWIYDLIARNRYHLFGKRESCRIPTADERKRFIL